MPKGLHIQDSNNQKPGLDELRILVKDCIARNRAAQRRMYELYAPGVYNVVRRYIFNEATAQELLNDTFLKIFTRLEQYSWQGPIEAWMRRIAVNTITDYLRVHIKHEQIEKTEVSEEDGYIDNDAVSNLSFKELVGYTYKLPDTHRAVFNLYVFESLIHKEIGQQLGISEGNSRWILNDARKKLKTIITSMM